MADASKAPKLFDVPGSVRFSVKPGQGKQALTAEELAKFSDYLKTSGVLISLNGLAAFSDDNGILIPEMLIRIGLTELIVTSRNLDPAAEFKRKTPWYKMSISSLFRRT